MDKKLLNNNKELKEHINSVELKKIFSNNEIKYIEKIFNKTFV